MKHFLSTIGELMTMLGEEKMWWLMPMMLCLAALGGLIYLGTSSAAAPFIYTLF
jgi:hypothetical protein